jgi:hypothetical protein
MNNYYFTFGQSHYNNEGDAMRNYWVRVVAADYMTARLMFINEFSSLNMPRSDMWAFQYLETNFEPKYFPGGEFAAIGDRKKENV